MANDSKTRLYMKLVFILALIAASAVVLWKVPLRLGLDLRGGSELLYKIRTEDLSAAEKRDIVNRTISVIQKRIDPHGRMELDIRPRGKDRFYVQLPRTKKQQAQIEDIIRRAGNLRFCLVNEDPEKRTAARRGERIFGFIPFLPVYDKKSGKPKYWRRATYKELTELPPAADDWLLVEDPRSARVTGESLDRVTSGQDQAGKPSVNFSFRGLGRRAFERLTELHRGKRLAIILDAEDHLPNLA